jgi:putative membrane protein
LQNNLLKYFLPITLALGVLRSWLGAADLIAWLLECAPWLAGMVALVVTREKMRLTHLTYWLIWAATVAALVGAHYTPASPPFARIRFNFRRDEDSYDLLVYLLQGVALAMLLREVMLRKAVARRGKQLAALSLLVSLGLSCLYGILQWGVETVLEGPVKVVSQSELAANMTCVLLGAALALLVLSARQDRALRSEWKSRFGPMRWIDVIA